MRWLWPWLVLLLAAAPGFAQDHSAPASPDQAAPPAPPVSSPMALGAPAPPASAPVKPDAPAAEAAAPLSFEFDSDFNTRYVWRGLALSDGAVQQSSLSLSARKLSFSVWSNYVLSQGAYRNRFNEVDLTLGYSQELKGFSFEPSLNLYTYPQGNAPVTTEMTLKLSHPVGGVSLYTSQTFDIQQYAGAYYGELGATRDHKLSAQLTASGGLSLGWASARFNAVNLGVAKTAPLVAGAQLSATYTGRGFYVRPHLGFTSLLDRRLREAVKEPNIFTIGVAVGREF